MAGGPKGYFVRINTYYPLIADGYFVGVSAQIFYH
jgi:hypothetical protein